MSERKGRISFNIAIPSEQLLGFLRQAITDSKTLSAVKKNPRALLAEHGIAIDESVTDDILDLFCATLAKARAYMTKKKLPADAFAKTFSICRVPGEVEADKKGAPRRPRVSTTEYGRNRGRSIRFMSDIESQPNAYWYKENSINFPGSLKDREPLLHIFTLSKLIVELNVAMKKPV